MNTCRPYWLGLLAIFICGNSAAISNKGNNEWKWFPKKERPFNEQEILFIPEVKQPNRIRVTKIEAAYRKKNAEDKLDPEVICATYYLVLEKRPPIPQGVVNKSFGCRVGVGLSPKSDEKTATGVMHVHYPNGSIVTENIAMTFTVCEPNEDYDYDQHLCVGNKSSD